MEALIGEIFDIIITVLESIRDLIQNKTPS